MSNAWISDGDLNTKGTTKCCLVFGSSIPACKIRKMWAYRMDQCINGLGILVLTIVNCLSYVVAGSTDPLEVLLFLKGTKTVLTLIMAKDIYLLSGHSSKY